MYIEILLQLINSSFLIIYYLEYMSNKILSTAHVQ